MRQLVCTEERIAKVEELINQRVTAENIARAIGVSTRSAGRMIAILRGRGKLQGRKRGCRGVKVETDNQAVKIIQEMSYQGYSQRQIGERLGVTNGTVWNIMKKYGIEKGEEMGSSGRKDSVKDLYESGLSPDAISAKLGISINGVYAVLDALPKKEPIVSQESNIIEKPIVEETLEEAMERLRKSEEEKETVERVDTEKVEDTEETKSEESTVENPSVTLGKVLCGLFKAHGTLLTSWGNNTNITNDGMDMFVISERLNAAEKEVFAIGRMIAGEWVSKDE